MSTNLDPDDASRYRQRLYEVREAPSLSTEERLERFLTIGREYLDVDNGHIERIVDGADTHEVVASVTDGAELFPVGTALDAATTYCRRTVQSPSPLALSNASEQGMASDPAYHEHGFECYLGAPVSVRGETYGTVCFLSHAARGASFTPLERSFVELVARLVGQELERERYERALDENEQARRDVASKYEALLQAAPDAIVLVDAETGAIVETNEAAAELTGYDRETLRDLSVIDLHPPARGHAYAALLEGPIDGTETRSELPDGSQLRVRRRDGTDVPVEVSAKAVEIDGRRYVQGVVRDVSDRLERERELRVKNRAIDEASVGITIADADGDNEIVYANEQFQRLTGYDGARIEGENCRLLQGPDTDPASVADLREAIAAEEPVRRELLNYRRDGTPFWNEVSITPVEDDTGEVTHYVGFQRDVTERKRRERIISVLNRVLRHNLRNRMNAVTGRTEILAETLDGEAAAHARAIGETAWDLVDLSEDARRLETAIREGGASEPLDVVPIVEAAAADCRTELGDATIQCDAPATATALASEELRHAVRELVTNAVEHGGDAPSVEVAVDTTATGRVTITVADDGPGLPTVERDLLRGGTETALNHGDGLGLWLVNWIVTDVGGTLDVTVDDGTTVTVTLREPDTEAESTADEA